ncbi:bifunctional UDP-N-acetylglucosamine diphosphorylase/glucosamine-1-phosphate N-acetyltransferase GlmU [Francisella tularensis]|uniref:Bifunctional protein GlmU n=1 Tax=Francisella tularensis subsp. holarctica (strain OSU18) TaxID=393011 RepID=GLMU_FRATO|nr:bifunctional UDP-N-acetylglucosamine diphosphorylase/glucosamine-1-phosphate N-acetyltransferase GlmU [Francisella tularensis]Q0BN96.1 RecName: Full=Bifunctional protein GlmU; Includes: RecName: Full=UDP-N-acetylglucosamine pyrophosphorylase; AltName: Full=N-acetylglucosamine-1-phosphate uridyltransferase; Includes: RecName: Full=Glucosamine-1-phosphate N-acetyltransferase [Francisella tularensis subsp. holarctica OSU18]ABI82438.1 UDP-N-acetylglucosamine diphosphorylase [Francisella tularensis
MGLSVVILAAGKGSRMNSNKPKVLQTLAAKTLIEHVVSSVEKLNPDNIVVVTGHLKEQVEDALQGRNITFVYQQQQLGTGHAVLQALPYLKEQKVLILYGDVPLISTEVLENLVDTTNYDDLGVLTAFVENPQGLGRIVRDKFGAVTEIVEEKDANDIQRQIKEINTGIYCVHKNLLQKWLPEIKANNVQKEYYLTDIITFAKADHVSINVTHPINEFEILGVNDRTQLASLERVWQRNVAEKIMAKGVSIADPNRFDVRGNLDVGKDCWIDINVIIKGNVKLGNNVVIGANCILKNCIIEDNVRIKSNSMVDGSIIREGAIVGPFARVRPECDVKEGAVIGNFVEAKKTILGKGSKASHLTYLGDSEIGANCNIGAGVITCNYDGVNKHKTVIGDYAFIGSDSQLIAPVNIGQGATVGAGSTIVKDVPADNLAISRARQRHIDTWQRSVKKTDK